MGAGGTTPHGVAVATPTALLLPHTQYCARCAHGCKMEMAPDVCTSYRIKTHGILYTCKILVLIAPSCYCFCLPLVLLLTSENGVNPSTTNPRLVFARINHSRTGRSGVGTNIPSTHFWRCL